MATLSVLYFFDVKEDQEQVFIENWNKLTALIYEYQDVGDDERLGGFNSRRDS